MLYEQRAPLRTAPALTELPVSSRECKQSGGRRRLFPDQSLIFPFMCSLVYLNEKKKLRKNKSLSRALTIISQKKPRRSSLMLACVIRGHPFFILYLFFYSTFSIYMVYLTCENVSVTSRSDCIWYDTNPYV